jgi:hypothetical protein
MGHSIVKRSRTSKYYRAGKAGFGWVGCMPVLMLARDHVSDIKKWQVNDSDEPGKPSMLGNAFSRNAYIKRAIREEVEARLLEIGWMLPTRTSSPLSAQGYRPEETDRTPELGGEQQTYYQGCWLVYWLRWICELGRTY